MYEFCRIMNVNKGINWSNRTCHRHCFYLLCSSNINCLSHANVWLSRKKQTCQHCRKVVTFYLRQLHIDVCTYMLKLLFQCCTLVLSPTSPPGWWISWYPVDIRRSFGTDKAQRGWREAKVADGVDKLSHQRGFPLPLKHLAAPTCDRRLRTGRRTLMSTDVCALLLCSESISSNDSKKLYRCVVEITGCLSLL